MLASNLQAGPVTLAGWPVISHAGVVTADEQSSERAIAELGSEIAESGPPPAPVLPIGQGDTGFDRFMRYGVIGILLRWGPRGFLPGHRRAEDIRNSTDPDTGD